MAHAGGEELAPWVDAQQGGPAFVCLWTTGPDTMLDGVFRILAMAPGSDGGWRTFDRFCEPFPDSEQRRSTARMAREFGVTGADLEGAPTSTAAWAELEEFLGDDPAVVLDAQAFENWATHLGEGATPPACVGLVELAALFVPGRLAQLREGLVDALLPPPGRSGPPAALQPPELRAALAELAGRFLALDPRALTLAAHGYARAWHGLTAGDPGAAERLTLALSLVERPSRWSASAGELFAAPGSLADGRISAALAGRRPDGWDDPLDPARGLLPHVAVLAEDWRGSETVPPRRPDPEPLSAGDLDLLDDLFQVHLPARMASELGGAAESYHRAPQRTVAREVARTLGADELLAVHAPTGTGKTAAYLAPALLWSVRNGVRVGVSTYTRALQEQAMDQEVPRVLAALARGGFGGARVAVLKGRENYLCYRALRLLAPGGDEQPESWLAWTSLALFALGDPDGDLDRFPIRAPLPLADGARYRSQLAGLVRAVRARGGCCIHPEDRDTCAGELARRRAERCHVVITNHAFALARQGFFAHLVFDECEHLHEVAASALSHALAFRWVRDLLARLRGSRPGSRRERPAGRAPLDRLMGELPPAGIARQALERAQDAWEEAVDAVGALQELAGTFERWRARALRAREARDQHGLLREYLEGPEGAPLVQGRLEATQALGRLDAGLSGVLDVLDREPLRGLPRLRRSLELGRADLVATVEALEAWLPVKEGRPALSPATFHDVQRDPTGGLVLIERVLLPNEVLGRVYYPKLASAAFVSATTRLSGGFDAAMGYLGLDRAAEPAPDEEGVEEREGRRVRAVTVPGVFDYRRVLVGVPRDAPHVRDKQAFLAYVTRFLDGLGERTRGRILALFTNLDDVRVVGEALAPSFRARQVPLWYQGMAEAGKEELSELFRARVDSVLLGVDTFWFGADFPGETLQYLVIVRLPYGVPDRYHHAQCAVLGEREQRRRIYMPRALAKFRQGFGRLMRRASDRGCVFVLDKRVLDPRHRAFLGELPVGRATGFVEGREDELARFVRGDTAHVVREALAHMDMLADVRRRGLAETFEGRRDAGSRVTRTQAMAGSDGPLRARPAEPAPRVDVPLEDLPF